MGCKIPTQVKKFDPRSNLECQMFGPPTINSDPNRGASQGRPGSCNCHPYRGIPHFVCLVWAIDYKFRHLAAATLKRDTRPILPTSFGFVAEVVWCTGGRHPGTGFGAHTVQILWISGRLWKLLLVVWRPGGWHPETGFGCPYCSKPLDLLQTLEAMSGMAPWRPAP